MVAKRVNRDCGAFMAGVLEYLTGEILELGCGITDAKKKKTLKPSHINLGIRQDDELAKIFYGAQLSESGVLPNIHANLLKGKKGASSQAM